MATSLTIQENLKRQLNQAKKADDFSESDQGQEPQPKWLSNLTGPAFVSPQVQQLVQHFSNLLLQLPMMVNTHNQPAIEVYFKKLVEEVTKIYAFPLQAIDVDPKLSDQTKSDLMDEVLEQLRLTIHDLAQRLDINLTAA